MTDEELTRRFEALRSTMGDLETQFQQRFSSLETLLMNVSQSLTEEITDVRAIVGRFSARLDKIAAGTHYVTRLVEWSEKQDKFQTEILERVVALEERIRELEKGRNGDGPTTARND